MFKRIFLVSVLVVGGTACSFSKGSDDPKPDYSVKELPGKSAFMEGCYDGSNRSYCECGWAYLNDNYSWSELRNMDRSEMESVSADAAVACQDYL